MKILSIDVGIRNLAMCLLNDDNNLIEQWDVSGIPPQHEDGVYVSLRKHLDDRPWTLEADVTLIEKQPDRNKKMKSVENFLHAYFVIKNPQKETIIYDARHKIPDVAGPGRSQYLKRKKTSIDRCEEFIHDGSTNAHWISVFNASKKKDDLADTVMQALSYTRRPLTTTSSTATRSSKKKLVPRKPNENQKATKYSKSNLAWLYLHTQGCEDNKRFMKDLHRYFRNIDELTSSL